MSVPEFSEDELHGTGSWPWVPEKYGTYYGVKIEYMGGLPKRNYPIIPKENFEHFRKREEMYWIPALWSPVEFIQISPYVNPDCVACSYDGGIDSFGVKWTPVRGKILPAIVKPGHPLLTDVTEWRDVVKFPDVDSWNWEESGKAFQALNDHERAKIGIIPTSLFERFIDLMEFEEAAMSLVAEPEESAALMQALADYNISIIEHYKKYYDIDIVEIHDDWGSQRSPLFSRDTLRTVIAPAYSRMVKRAHELGIFVISHCCGCCESFIDEMIETGTDVWQLQVNANPHIRERIPLYKDKFFFVYTEPVPTGLNLEEIKAWIRERYINVAENKNCAMDIDVRTISDMSIVPEVNDYIYEMSRKICSGEI